MSTFIKTGYWETAKDRKKGWLDLEALILKVTGGGGGGPTLQSVLENSNIAEDITIDMIDGAVRAFATSDPNSRHTVVNSEGVSVFDTNSDNFAVYTKNKLFYVNNGLNAQIELELTKSTSGVVIYKFDETKTSGTFTLATTSDLAAKQFEIGSSQPIDEDWNGNTVIFNTSCTITVPATLPDNFIFNGITLAGVTVTWAIIAPHTWLFGTPGPTQQKQIFTLTKRGNTNSILLLGV